MKFVDQDAVYTLIAKEAASKMLANSLRDIRGALSEKNVDILAGVSQSHLLLSLGSIPWAAFPCQITTI